MANLVFNIAKGRVAYYATLPAASDALVAVPIETAGLQADATLRDFTNLSALLAGTTNEQVTMGRKTLTSVVVNVNNTTDLVEVDCDDIAWLTATGNPISAIIICYDPDTTVGTDSDLIPLVKLDAVATPNGGDITYQVASTGFYRAQ